MAKLHQKTFSLTCKAMRKKIWSITGALTQDDIEWVHRAKLECTLGEQRYVEVTMYAASAPVQIPGIIGPAEIVTTNGKEETWLKLYFADRAFLLAEESDHKYC